MKQQATLYGIIGLLLGSLLTIFITQVAVNTENRGMMRMMGLNQMMRSEREDLEDESEQVGMGMSMNRMMDSMSDKKGVSFDKAFLESMIVHHQGAIEMAKEAQQKAQHPEVKKLADDIIAAQTSEIEQMKKWISDWGL